MFVTLVFWYAIGAMLGFGLSYTTFSYTDAKDRAQLGSLSEVCFIGTIFSWVTILFFLAGVFRGMSE